MNERPLCNISHLINETIRHRIIFGWLNLFLLKRWELVLIKIRTYVFQFLLFLLVKWVENGKFFFSPFLFSGFFTWIAWNCLYFLLLMRRIKWHSNAIRKHCHVGWFLSYLSCLIRLFCTSSSYRAGKQFSFLLNLAFH